MSADRREIASGPWADDSYERRPGYISQEINKLYQC